MVGWGSHFSHPSTTTAISCPGDLFAFHQSLSRVFSRHEGSPSFKANLYGFGFPRYCLRPWYSHCAGGTNQTWLAPSPDVPIAAKSPIEGVATYVMTGQLREPHPRFTMVRLSGSN